MTTPRTEPLISIPSGQVMLEGILELPPKSVGHRSVLSWQRLGSQLAAQPLRRTRAPSCRAGYAAA
jgi:hypothetical protein